MKPISPWDARLYSIRQRCSGNPRLSHTCYFKNKIKCLITADEIKDLWFRDKADLMDKPSIDRIDGSKHYSKDNCRFIELKENSRSKIYRDHCPAGHLLSGDNLYIRKSHGWTSRVCRKCSKTSRNKYIEKRKLFNAKCTVCDRALFAKGFCSLHYRRNAITLKSYDQSKENTPEASKACNNQVSAKEGEGKEV